MITLGVHNFLKEVSQYKSKRVGLIANGASVDQNFISSVDLIHRAGFNLTTIFGPQQGFWGETQANMIEWGSTVFPHTNIPLYSLYGEHRKPTAEMLSDVDVLVFDVPDNGTRVYTFIWTMVLAMQACAENKKEFVVCDRPNPIGGQLVEGNVSQRDHSSFVALYPLPLRHGMTCGEIAQYVNKEFHIGCQLKIVSMSGWKRSQWMNDTGMPWILLTANMPTLETATVYPGTVIFEGTNISEGRGTTRPFEFIGAPYIDGFKLAESLTKENLLGVIFRPCVFCPTFDKYKGINCGGVHLHVTDKKSFQPVRVALALLKHIHDLYPKDFAWTKPPYEYVFDKLPIDVIFGCAWIREDIETGLSVSQICQKMEAEIVNFQPVRGKYLLY